MSSDGDMQAGLGYAAGMSDSLPVLSASPPRQRDAEATRGAILEAAHELFCQRGFDGAGTRDIAQAAGVDARLITRYFGSKEQLFAEVVEVAYQKPILMTPGQNRAVAVALLSDAPATLDSLTLTLRSASNERAAEIMRQHLEQHYQARLAESLTGPDAPARAALLISICAGIQLMRNVIKSSALQNVDVDQLADYLEAALDSIAEERDTGQAR
jgi:AcrR family transcriptional regulator